MSLSSDPAVLFGEAVTILRRAGHPTPGAEAVKMLRAGVRAAAVSPDEGAAASRTASVTMSRAAGANPIDSLGAAERMVKAANIFSSDRSVLPLAQAILASGAAADIESATEIVDSIH